MSVGEICSRVTHLVDLDESAQAAANRMNKENVGTLVVVDADRKPIGIVTDRDLALRVLAPALDARATTVEQVMTAHPCSVRERTPIEDAVATMRHHGIRRLLVVDGAGRLAGILSVDDVLELVTEELGNLGRIVGWSHPGITLPQTRAPRSKESARSEAGLQHASADPEC